MIGTVLHQRYRITRQLGEGGMGAVWEAEDLEADRRVAVKLVVRELAAQGAFLKRFQREARVAAAIDESHIAAVYETGVDETSGLPFIAMERLEGADLDEHLRRTPELDVDVALRVAAQTCQGLAAAHEAGVVHRDIKPSNLFLAEGEGGALTVKLLDFGIAKLRAELTADLRSSVLTQTGAVLGSPIYMSPEQARGSNDIDLRTDIWSAGVVLYQMLSGRVPKPLVDGVGSLIVSICTEPAKPIQMIAPWVSREVATVVHTALALRREARFQTAAEMRDVLLSLLHERDDSLRTSMLVPPSAEARRNVAPAQPLGEAATAVDAEGPTAEAARGPARILVIEDNEMNMDMLSRRLERKGYVVLKASDGAAGVEMARGERPDLVLMDIGLPDMDGWSAVIKIRATPEGATTPVIALTAHATAFDRERALEVGCNDFETKPVELPRLLAKIESLLKRGSIRPPPPRGP